MLDILHGLVIGERLELAGQADALPQLAEFEGIDHLSQLGLAHQHDLQQFVARGFQVGQEPHLLEGFHRQVLGLVDDDHHLLIFGFFLDQEGIQYFDELLGGVGIGRNPELGVDIFEQLEGIQFGVEDVGTGNGGIELLKKCTAQGAFAGADFARNHEKTLSLAQGEFEMGEGFLVGRAQE